MASSSDRDESKNTICVEEIRLVDKTGVLRAHLSVDEQGSVGFTLQDKKGQPHVEVKVADYGDPSIRLRDRDGNVRAVFALIGDVPQMTLLTGRPFNDKHHYISLQLLADNEGPRLVLNDANGRTRAVYFVDDYGPAMIFFDENKEISHWEPKGDCPACYYIKRFLHPNAIKEIENRPLPSYLPRIHIDSD